MDLTLYKCNLFCSYQLPRKPHFYNSSIGFEFVVSATMEDLSLKNFTFIKNFTSFQTSLERKNQERPGGKYEKL
jgi:hypothetical protein